MFRCAPQAINGSLSALGDVISALATGAPHVPFRNSKLTHLLSASLRGRARVVMVVNASPAPRSVKETLCSLRFAARCQKLALGRAAQSLAVVEVKAPEAPAVVEVGADAANAPPVHALRSKVTQSSTVEVWSSAVSM